MSIPRNNPSNPRKRNNPRRNPRPGAPRSEPRHRADDRREAGGSTNQKRSHPPRHDDVEGNLPPDDVDPTMLDPAVRAELRALSKEHADRVARHLVAAGMLIDEDPHEALRQARFARSIAARIGVVREAAGVSAYAAGEWAEALSELRAAQRLTGDVTHLPLMADAERALGRPERALRLIKSAQGQKLSKVSQIELRIVESGARRDLGEIDAAVQILQGPDLNDGNVEDWTVRLWYAYAEALLAAGRPSEAGEWFRAVVGVDEDQTTDAEERLADIEQR